MRHRNGFHRIPWNKLDISNPLQPRLLVKIDELSRGKNKSVAPITAHMGRPSVKSGAKALTLTFLFRWIAPAVLFFSLLLLLFFYTTEARPAFSPTDSRFAAAGDPAKGQRIFDAGDCSSCHATPGQSDRLNLGGGMALSSPFGTFRPPNISTDPVDGIGKWSTVDLANALIGGVNPHGQHYYPAFPYTSFTGMSLADVNDLFAYLRTLPKVSGRPPPHTPALLFATRRFVGAWKLLFFREGETQIALNGDAVHDRGAYLVENIAHCAECHSSRNLLGAIKPKTRFAGGLDPEGTGYVPNITPDRLENWTDANIVAMLKTGETPGHGRVGSSMADVVINTSRLPDEDLQAIASYIKSLPRRPTPRP